MSRRPHSVDTLTRACGLRLHACAQDGTTQALSLSLQVSLDLQAMLQNIQVGAGVPHMTPASLG
jgi:hypothetical protein